MTNTLVIDTSFGSTVGIVGYEPMVETDSRTHVERLQTNIGTVVEAAGLKPDDLELIVVGVGPAPFTGLRAGIVTAKALAFATGAQLVGQDILKPQASMVARALRGDTVMSGVDFLNGLTSDGGQTRHVVLAVNDARRRQLYFSLYDGLDETDEGHMRALIEMDIDYPDRIAERVNARMREIADGSDGHMVVDVVGHGAAKYAQAWQGLEDLGQVIDHSVLDTGAAGLEIFAQCASEDDESPSDKTVEPLYLRRPDVSVPNPLKHVLNHGGATRSER